MTRILAPFLLSLLLPAAAAAQDGGMSLPDDVGSALSDAVSTLKEEGQDKVLVGDLMGKTVKGADGNTVGTIKNLAALPGGKIVAVLVEMPDGQKVGLPFQTIKLGKLAGKASGQGDITVPMTKQQLSGMQQAQELASAITP